MEDPQFRALFQWLVNRCELAPDTAATLLQRIVQALSVGEQQKDSS